MAKMIQVRNVPDALHRALKARAAVAGMTLSDYLLVELQEISARPTPAEFRRLSTPAKSCARNVRGDDRAGCFGSRRAAPSGSPALITRDQKIAAAPGHAATIEVF